MMHELVSVSGLCFPDDDLGATVERLEDLGAHLTTVQATKVRSFGWDDGIDLLASSSVDVAGFVDTPAFELGVPGTWDATRSRMIATLDAAAALGSRAVYVITGRLLDERGEAAPWDDAAAAFVEAIGPVAAHARSVGVQLAVEPTVTLFADLNMVHSLADALLLLERCDLGVCLDLFHVWTDPKLEEHIAALSGRIALVQVSDQDPGERSFPCRSVPGDGAVPLTRALRAVLDAGYDGPIDVELSGPRIDAEGHVNAARRAASRIEATLLDLGLPTHRLQED